MTKRTEKKVERILYFAYALLISLGWYYLYSGPKEISVGSPQMLVGFLTVMASVTICPWSCSMIPSLIDDTKNYIKDSRKKTKPWNL